MATKKPVTLFDTGFAWAERQVKNLSLFASRLRSPLAGKLAIGAAFLIYFIGQFYLSAAPTLVRQTPVEADDAYSYIVKAAAMQTGCLSEDCPAMTSLRAQLLSPTDNLEAASIRHREYHRIFYFYHPVHSLILSGLNTAGLTWEQAYDAVWIAGKILIIFAVAHFMLSVWGPSAGSIALIFLSVTVLQGQGLHAVVPGNLALALALILWAEIYKKTARLTWLMPILITLLLLMHPIGRLYGILILAFAVLDTDWPPKRKEAIGIGLSLLLVAFYLGLPSLIPSVELAFNPRDFYPGTWSYTKAFIESVTVTSKVVLNWTAHWGGIIFVIPFVILGLISYRQDQKRLILMFGVLLGFAVASFFYVVPFYGALGFERAWVILAIFLVGAIAQGFFALFMLIGSLLRNKKPVFLKEAKWRAAFVVVLGLFLLFSAGRYWAIQWRNYSSTYDGMAFSGESLFNSEQPAMTNETGPFEAILYMEELSLYYYLSHGALASQAVYYPAVAGTPEEAKWVLDQSADFNFVVARNPIYRLPHTPDGFIKLNLQETVTIISAAPFGAENLQVFIGARSGTIILTLTLVTGEAREDLRVAIPEGDAGWVTLVDEPIPVERIVLRMRQTSEPLEIGGLRFNESSSNLWPWDEGKTLIFRTEAETETEITFSSIDLISQLPFQLEVVDDKGASVLARVVDPETTDNLQ